MSIWDFLANHFPPLALTLTGIAATVVILIGFSRHGMDFIKHGFIQVRLSDSLESRLDNLAVQMNDVESKLTVQINGIRSELNGVKTEVNGIRSELNIVKTELDDIKNNHFVHLKKYLGVLNGILLNKQIIDNKDRALLDNELIGM